MGIKNTSKTEPLVLFYIWWLEDEDNPGVLNIGGKFTDPERAESADTVLPHADPIPSVRSK